jgi:hypothetical protein
LRLERFVRNDAHERAQVLTNRLSDAADKLIRCNLPFLDLAETVLPQSCFGGIGYPWQMRVQPCYERDPFRRSVQLFALQDKILASPLFKLLDDRGAGGYRTDARGFFEKLLVLGVGDKLGNAGDRE